MSRADLLIINVRKAFPQKSGSHSGREPLFCKMPVSVLGEARLSGARSNRLEGLESHRVGDTERQGYEKKRKLCKPPLLSHSNLDLKMNLLTKIPHRSAKAKHSGDYFNCLPGTTDRLPAISCSSKAVNNRDARSGSVPLLRKPMN